MESLIKCGAFDSLKASRAQLLSILDKSIQIAQDRQREKRNGQVSLFAIKSDDLLNNIQENFDLEEVKEFSDQELLTMEKEILGFYLSHHPLQDYQDKLSEMTNADSASLENFSDKSKVVLGGIITNLKRKATKNGNVMAYFSLEDLHGTVEIIVFPKTLEENKEILKEENIVIVEGRLDTMELNIKLLAESITPINNYEKKDLSKQKKKSKSISYLHIEVDFMELDLKKLEGLKKIFQKYQGRERVVIHFKSAEKIYHQYVDEDIMVQYNQDLVEEIEEHLPQSRVWRGKDDYREV
jgi:DNA polymerase-3 subunit alpha